MKVWHLLAPVFPGIGEQTIACLRHPYIAGDLASALDIAIETAGVPQALDLAYKITKRGGTTVAAGMPGPEASITLSHLSLAGEERTLKGSYMGSCVPSRDIPRYMGLFQDGKLPIDRLTSHQISLDDLNEGFDRMAEGSVVRQVMVL